MKRRSVGRLHVKGANQGWSAGGYDEERRAFAGAPRYSIESPEMNRDPGLHSRHLQYGMRKHLLLIEDEKKRGAWISSYCVDSHSGHTALYWYLHCIQ